MHAWVLAQTEAVHPQYFLLSVTALKPIPKSYSLCYHNITFLLICPVYMYFNTFYIVSAKSHGSEFRNLNMYFISFVCSLFLESSFLIILSISHSDARKSSWFLLSIHFLYTFTLLQCNSHYCFFFFFYLPNWRVYFSSYRSNFSLAGTTDPLCTLTHISVIQLCHNHSKTEYLVLHKIVKIQVCLLAHVLITLPPSYSFSNDSTDEKSCLYKNKNNKTIHNDTELASELWQIIQNMA